MGAKRGVVAGVCAGVLGVAALSAPSVGSVDTRGTEGSDRAAYTQPKAGPWKFLSTEVDPYSGSFTIKAGVKGKPPMVKKLRYTATEVDSGLDCPAPGVKVKVKGSFRLLKATKYTGGTSGSPWLLAAKDKPYDSDKYYSTLGAKPVKVTTVVGTETRKADLVMFFHQDKLSKPHLVRSNMRLFPVGATGDSQGWCRISPDAKPGK